jgi:hypothetical protein
MSFTWNYQMIKVGQEDEDEIGLIVEVVYKEGNPEGFALASINSIEELNMIHKDVSKQGGKLNTWFWDNGTFTHKAEWNGESFDHRYSWVANKPVEDDSDDDDSWRQEQATQAGMAGGLQAYTDASDIYVGNPYDYDRDDIWDYDED